MAERAVDAHVEPDSIDLKRPKTPTPGQDLKTLVNEYERQLILTALGATRGHQRRAARFLGISPSSLHEKMKRLGIKVMPTWTGGGGAGADRQA